MAHDFLQNLRTRLRSWLRFFFRRPAAETPAEERPPSESVADESPEDLSGDVSRPVFRSHKPRFFRVRERLHPVWRWALSVIPFALFALWWVWATAGAEPEFRRISPTILPSPAEVFGQCGSLWFDSALMRNVLVSLGRVLSGFAVAAIIALPLGVLMAVFARIGATFGLLATLLSYLPIPAIVPLTYFWWKTGEEQKIGFLALGTFAYLLPLVVRHISAVDHKYVLSANAQGASPWQVVFRVLVPIALPDIFNAMRLCLGIGWTYIVLAEVIKTGGGLGGVGNLIMVFQRLGHPEGVYLTLAAIMLVGALLDRSCAWITGRLFPYHASTARNG